MVGADQEQVPEPAAAGSGPHRATAAASAAASHSPSRPRPSRRRSASACGALISAAARDHDHLLDTAVLDLFEQPGDRLRPVAQPVRLAAPVALGRKGHRPRLAHDGQARERRREHVHAVVAVDARQVERLAGPLRPHPRRCRRPKNAGRCASASSATTMSRRVSRSCTTTMQLPETGLTQVRPPAAPRSAGRARPNPAARPSRRRS